MLILAAGDVEGAGDKEGVGDINVIEKVRVIITMLVSCGRQGFLCGRQSS